MTETFHPPKRGGVAGLALLFCVALGGAGLAFDFVLNALGPHASLFAAPGGRALIGAGVALILVLSAHTLRRLLGRRLIVERDDA